jgi:hypothetical protein
MLRGLGRLRILRILGMPRRLRRLRIPRMPRRLRRGCEG